MWKSFDKRLAAFLLEESTLEETQVLKITHETIANHLGTAREVITRILKHMANDGIIGVTRKGITIVDKKKLQTLAYD